MDAGDDRANRLTVLSPLAVQDYAETHDHTAFAWGWSQAERYADMLDAAIREAAENPKAGKRIEDDSAYRVRYMKWPKAKYGHAIIYREIEGGVYVLRILHGAMNVSDYLKEV
ncbi:hypothetical protein BH11ARM2_BH11ARM2_04130 [soil metagenome]